MVYQQAKRAFDSAKEKSDLDPWRGNSIMDLVAENTLALHKEKFVEG